MIKRLLRPLVPQFLRRMYRRKARHKAKLAYWFRWVLPPVESVRCWAYLGRVGYTSYPYPFAEAYWNMPVTCEHDSERDLPYIMHGERRLYFPRSFTPEYVVFIYRTLRIEQDRHSAHQYVTSPKCLAGRTLLDVGAGEGIFTLDAIDFVSHAYVFDYLPDWIEALEATFEPWRSKVSIIKGKVSNRDEGEYITLDRFMTGKSLERLFLKMDIEGHEKAALQGASYILSTAPDLAFAICTYHYRNDARDIRQLLLSHGLHGRLSDGYLCIESELRRALLRSF